LCYSIEAKTWCEKTVDEEGHVHPSVTILKTNLFYDAKNRLIPQPQILPGYCIHCLREQTQRGEPAHLRAEWTLAFLTHSSAGLRAPADTAVQLWRTHPL